MSYVYLFAGCLCRCFHCFHRHAQTRLLLGIIFVMSLAVVIFEFCIITAEVSNHFIMGKVYVQIHNQEVPISPNSCKNS